MEPFIQPLPHSVPRPLPTKTQPLKTVYAPLLKDNKPHPNYPYTQSTNTYQPLPTVQSHTIHCPKCVPYAPAIMSTTTPLNLNIQRKLYCPFHSIPALGTESDGWDYYAISLNLSRNVTIKTLHTDTTQFIKTLKQPNTTNAQQYKHDYYRFSNGIKDPSLTNAEWCHELTKSMPTYPINMQDLHCTNCHSSFRLTISNKTILTHPPIHFCPYCAQPTLTNIPVNQDNFALEALAQAYNLPIESATDIYNMFTQQRIYPYFADYFEHLKTVFHNEILEWYAHHPNFYNPNSQVSSEATAH